MNENVSSLSNFRKTADLLGGVHLSHRKALGDLGNKSQPRNLGDSGKPRHLLKPSVKSPTQVTPRCKLKSREDFELAVSRTQSRGALEDYPEIEHGPEDGDPCDDEILPVSDRVDVKSLTRFYRGMPIASHSCFASHWTDEEEVDYDTKIMLCVDDQSWLGSVSLGARRDMEICHEDLKFVDIQFYSDDGQCV